MEIPLNVDVECTDGRCGRSTYIIINPISKKVTHFVVRESRWPHIERVVSLKQIRESNHDEILLKCQRNEFQKMTPFFDSQFVEVVVDDYPWDLDEGELYQWPDVSTRTKYIGMAKKQIPLDTLGIRRKTRVNAKDGHIGRVDEFLFDSDTMHITHLVMTEGHFWGEKDIVIPVDAIEDVTEDLIQLNLGKAQIEKLPTVPIHRHFTMIPVAA